MAMTDTSENLPADTEGIMEWLWPQIGNLWHSAVLLANALVERYCPQLYRDLLGALEPAEALLRRALMLLALEGGLARFAPQPIPPYQENGPPRTGPDREMDAEEAPRAPCFLLTESDPVGTFIDKDPSAPFAGPSRPDGAPTHQADRSPQYTALINRLEALNAALDDPWTHVSRLGRLLWKANAAMKPSPINLVSPPGLYNPDVAPDLAMTLSAVNGRVVEAVSRGPP